MKIYLVIEDEDYGSHCGMGEIHKAFKSKEKAEELAKKMLEDYEWMSFEKPFDIIYVIEMDVEDEE